MSPKMSSRLQALVNRSGVPSDVSPAAVKVRLRAGLRGAEVSATLRRLATWVGAADYVPISGTVHGRIRLTDAEQLAELAEVESIDLETSVPIEALLDR